MTIARSLVCWLAVLLCLNGFSTTPKPVQAVCPPFPVMPQELLQPAPTLYLVPKELRQK